jgi:hypothetical protein
MWSSRFGLARIGEVASRSGMGRALGHPKNPPVFRGVCGLIWGVSLRGGSIFEMVRTPTRFEGFCAQFGVLAWAPFSLAFFTPMLCMTSANWFHLFASLPFCVWEKAA